MAENGGTGNKGELIFKSNPNLNRNLIIILSFFVAFEFILFIGINDYSIRTMIIFTIVITIMFPLILYIKLGGFRFEIYENGIYFYPNKCYSVPSKYVAAGYKVGSRFIKYEEIVSIHPFISSIGKSKYFNNIGLQIVLPKEKGKFIAGWISLSGNRIKEIPEVIKIIKNQMGTIWESKYKPEQSIFSGFKRPDNIAFLIENGMYK